MYTSAPVVFQTPGTSGSPCEKKKKKKKKKRGGGGGSWGRQRRRRKKHASRAAQYADTPALTEHLIILPIVGVTSWWVSAKLRLFRSIPWKLPQQQGCGGAFLTNFTCIFCQMLAFVHRSYTRVHLCFCHALGCAMAFICDCVCVCVRERERERERERAFPSAVSIGPIQRVRFYIGISRRARAIRSLIQTFSVFVVCVFIFLYFFFS